MNTSPTDRYFYHSFPSRPGDNEIEKGLRILKSIGKAGLLLNPEKIIWPEQPLSDGKYSGPWQIIQKRACFTELAPSELQHHSTIFGHFALEFDVQKMRQLGGIPVFYIPRPSQDDVGMESLAASLVCRVGEIQLLLDRLGKIEKLIRNSNDKEQLLTVLISESGEKQSIRTSLGGAEDLLTFLTQGSQPVSILLNAIRGLSGFFCPTEDLGCTDLLGNYRLREWRILANMSKAGKEQTRDLSECEKTALLELDKEFFGREDEFPTGTHRIVDQCKYFQELEGRPFLSYVRRVVVPDEVVDKAVQILAGDGLPVVVPVSDLAYA